MSAPVTPDEAYAGERERIRALRSAVRLAEVRLDGALLEARTGEAGRPILSLEDLAEDLGVPLPELVARLDQAEEHRRHRAIPSPATGSE